MTTFMNPRLSAIPAEMMRSCVFAEDFVTKTRMEDNKASFVGVGITVDHGLTSRGLGYASFQNLLIDDYISMVVRFSATKTTLRGDLLSDSCIICGPGDDGFAIWVDLDGVKANHSNGGAPPTECAVDIDYSDGVIHTATYVIDMGAGTHTLYVDSLDPDVQVTTIDEELGASQVITVGGHGVTHYFSGSIYKARIFDIALTQLEHDVYHAATLETFLDNALATYRCDSISDDDKGHKIRDRHVEHEDLYKANRLDTAAFPTFNTDLYEFDGSDDYISNVQTLPDDYTITAAKNEPHEYPIIQQHNDLTFLDLLTTGGDFYGNLHSLILHGKDLAQLELYHDEYQHLYWLWRGRAFGAYHRLITEATCQIAMFLDSVVLPFRDYSLNLFVGTDTGVTHDGVDGCTFPNANSNITVSDDAVLRSDEGSIVLYGDFASGATGHVLDKGTNYKFQFSAVGTLNFNTSIYATGASDIEQIAVTFKDGIKPRFYVNGEFVGEGSAIVTVDDTDTTDLVIGNNNELNDPTPHAIKQAYLGDQALTDREVKALYEEAQYINATEHDYGMVLSTDDTGVFSFTTRGPADTGYWIDWGDGTALEWVQHLGTGTDVNTTHDYLGLTGTKKLTFSGELINITKFSATDTDIGGDIAAFRSLTNLTDLRLTNSNMIGDIVALANMASLTLLFLNGTAVDGDIASIAGLTSLNILYLHYSDVTGNISSLSALTSLQHLYFRDTSLTGDIGSLSAATSMINLYFQNTAIDGVINQISTLTSLAQLHGTSSSVTVSGAALAAWSNCTIYLYNCSWTSQYVDNFLIQLNLALGSNGTLNIAGNNAARTAASDAAKAGLLLRGWTITVNE